MSTYKYINVEVYIKKEETSSCVIYLFDAKDVKEN